MSLATASLWIASFWLVIYVVKYSATRPKNLELPLSQNRRPVTEVTVECFNIRLKTEAFNTCHGELITWLSSSSSRTLRQILLWLYDLGSLLGVLGMVIGFCLLLLTVVSLSSEILHIGRGNHHNASTITKRGLEHANDNTPSDAPASHILRISPIIPGVTVPLDHLPLILVALAISQIIHEAGHAITSALHRIPMLACGVSFTYFLPSAFVALPTARLEKLPPRDRLQVASGGCFHNLVFLCLLFSAAWLGIGFIPTRILFEDISALGKLVVGVDHDSPLATHLPIGTLITKIDDFAMASVPDDSWDHYLLSPPLAFMQGWCTNKSLLSEVSAPACISSDTYSCFVSKVDETLEYQLDPVRTFTKNSARCNSPIECSSLSTCLVPRRDQQLVRISVLRNYYAGASMEDMVVWRGPKEEIWEEVQVGNLLSRFPLLSSRLPKIAFSFFEYLKMANLSLYLINALPITGLDGYQLLVIVSQLFCSPASDGLQRVDLEAFGSVTRLSLREGRVQRICRTTFSYLALLLIALCALLGIISSWRKQ